jgi:thiosulfate dehydrogenase [quinone] large subunit
MSETNSSFSEVMFAVLRISVGWTFFWAFIDKTFGLGYYWYNEVRFGTDPAKAWISGGDPAYGFLAFGTQGKWFADFFSGMAGNGFVTFLYMFGLFGVGLAMLMGVGRKIAGAGGAILMVLMWAAELPLTNNPFLDEHILYAICLIILGFTPYFGKKYSLAGTFSGIIEQYPFLE